MIIRFKSKLEVFLTFGLALWLILLLLQGCSTLREKAVFKAKHSETRNALNQASEQFRSLDYRLYSQLDSSSFGAWIWLEDGFTFHPDSGIRGEKALLRYFGMRSSEKVALGASLVETKSETRNEELSEQREEVVTKEKIVRKYLGIGGWALEGF